MANLRSLSPAIDKHPADAVFCEDRPAALVVSHERSGTHFLMNALANCYGYVSDPWINLDPVRHGALEHVNTPSRPWPDPDTNYYDPKSIRDYLLAIGNRPLAAIVKTHFTTDFFGSELERITERYVIFYIHRHPVDMFVSFWKFIRGLAWCEGPLTETPAEFARATPAGALMRYQLRQHPTLMHRWAHNVEGWLAAAEKSNRIVIVRFDELKGKYSQLLTSFESVLGHRPNTVQRPDHGTSSWIRPKSKVKSDENAVADLRAACREAVGATMDRLGYQ